MRIPTPRLLALLVALLVAVPAPAALADDPIVVTGSGWGHGIGLPQYGARGMAEEGHSAAGILSHFYSGAVIGTVGQGEELTGHADPLRIGAAQNLSKEWFFANGNAITVCLGLECHTANPGESWTITANGSGGCWLARNEAQIGNLGTCNGEIRDLHPGARVVFPVLSREYARGRVIFEPAPANTFHVVVELGLEEYLYGLGEMPSSWHPAALQAQAIAGRSYALYKAKLFANLPANAARWAACACHLYASTLDQKYIGWLKEAEGTNGHWGNIWRQAVNDTANQALYHPSDAVNRAIEAYYFSSSGGATENNEEVWGGSPYLYLRSKPDSWSTNPAINPNASWTASITSSQVAAAFGFTSVNRVVVIERNTSGSARTVLVSGLAGETETSIHVPAGSFRSKLGLKSQYFSVDWTGVPILPEGADLAALHDPTSGLWTYRSRHGAISSIYFGNPGDHAFMGDWNCDGVATPGLYRRSDGFVYLRNSNTQGVADIAFFFGNPGDLPIAGDFNGNGCDTVSIYRPSQQVFYIINKLGQNGGGLGAADYSYMFGNPGDIPFAGDWNGDGVDTPGLRRPSNGFVYLKNSNSTGIADIEYFYGNPGDLVFAGDWDADGDDTLGLYRPSNGFVYLKNSNSTGIADITYKMGTSVHKPVAG